MAVTGERVTVTTSATKIIESDADGVSVLVRVPVAGTDVDCGGSGVTSGAGFVLGGGESLSISLDAGESLYGIVGSGTQAVQVLKNRDG